MKGLSEDQPHAAISAKIDAAKKDRRWEQTQACTNATASASRDFCQEVDGLRARLDVAATAGVLREKIDRLSKSIEKLRKQGAGQVADAQSAGFARLFQVEQDMVIRTGLSVLLALVIESVCCFGLLVIAGAHPDPRMAAAPSLPERIGEWLTERAEPHPGTRVSFRELENGLSEMGGGQAGADTKFQKIRTHDPRRLRRSGTHGRGGVGRWAKTDFIAAHAERGLVPSRNLPTF